MIRPIVFHFVPLINTDMLEVQIRRGSRRICNACASGVPIIVYFKKTQELVYILVNILKNQDSTLNQTFCT